jgi:hypothetical protein
MDKILPDRHINPDEEEWRTMSNYNNEKTLLLMLNDRPQLVTELLTKKYGYTLSQLQLRRNNNISLNDTDDK